MNDTYPDRVRNTLLGKVQRLGIHVVLDDSAENLTPSADGTVTLKSGKVLQADLVIPTFGGTPNTDFIKSSLGEGVLTSTKHVKVLPTLQLPGFSNILAAGDVIDWAEQKQAAKAPAHASVVVKNVTALLNGQKPTAEYKGSFELILITLGRVSIITVFFARCCSYHILVGRLGILWRFVGTDLWRLVREASQVQKPHDRYEGERDGPRITYLYLHNIIRLSGAKRSARMCRVLYAIAVSSALWTLQGGLRVGCESTQCRSFPLQCCP